MINNSEHASSAPDPETECRIVDLKGKRPLLVRRSLLKLRRIRSFSSVSSKLGTEVISGEANCPKMKRNEELLFSTPAKKSSVLPSPESDVIVSDASTSRGGEGGGLSSEEKSITCVSHGSISVIGRRRDMEDAVAIEEGFIDKGLKKYDFFGVYDGHGGARVAHVCRGRLHEVIIEQVDGEVEVDEGVRDWERVMKTSFVKMDDEVNRNGKAVAMMGSTAVVAVVGEEELVVANCGDSRAVLFRDGAAVALSEDHKPDRPDELARIEDGGGKVINWNGQRVLGVLATSRSIGDHYLKPFVISEPEVRVMRRTDKDEFVILGSDGLWDVISNDLVCEIVKRCLDGQLRSRDSKNENNCLETFSTHAAALLAELAIARGSTDNISVIVIELQRLR